MLWNFDQISVMFSGLTGEQLLNGNWGIEREAQRVTAQGELALTTHPSAFGSKLYNNRITTDFSESQLELITPPFPSIKKAYDYLGDLHNQVERELKDEYMWPLSMPPRLPEDDKIPIARFGDSWEGREKEIYRMGLATRYGKKMQMISGIHYNFSFGEKLINTLYGQFGTSVQKQDFVDIVYFATARNYLRFRWLLVYLFGASPSFDPSYSPVVYQELEKIRQCCPECCDPVNNYEQYATSLRVSRFGYADSVRGRDSVSYNSKAGYIQDIRRLMALRSHKFGKIGLFRNGVQIQLNSNILQKESEFYSSIRLKQVAEKGESQLDALESRGVKYAEVRILDLNPYEKEGISLNEMRFLHIFMLLCLFEQSNFLQEGELKILNMNHHLIALSGRKQGLTLYRFNGRRIQMNEWCRDIFERLGIIAKLLDAAQGGGVYQECIAAEYEKVVHPSLLPSSLMQQDMKIRGESFIRFGLRKAMEHGMQMAKSLF